MFDAAIRLAAIIPGHWNNRNIGVQFRLVTYRTVMLRTTIVAAFVCVGACARQNQSGAGDVEPDEQKFADPKLKTDSFDPRVFVEWPVAPEESRNESGETKSYTAIAAVRRESGFATFKLLVTTYSEAAMQKYTAKDLIESCALAGKDSETSRRVLELSAKKYPALEITQTIKGARGRSVFTRELVFVAGNRLVGVSVGGSDGAYINGPEVDAFFKSLRIGD